MFISTLLSEHISHIRNKLYNNNITPICVYHLVFVFYIPFTKQNQYELSINKVEFNLKKNEL
jgi:hypothetical protein